MVVASTKRRRGGGRVLGGRWFGEGRRGCRRGRSRGTWAAVRSGKAGLVLELEGASAMACVRRDGGKWRS